MITFYKFSFNGTWELEKPRKPSVFIFPPPSDVENLLQPPDLSGIDLSNPVDDVCGLFLALIEQAIKSIDAAIKLVEDLIKLAASPATYLLRLGLYEVAMLVWNVAMTTHEVLAHTGFITPHAEQRFSDGELRLPDEIDDDLVTLGGTVDATFRTALAAAFDPLGNLDKHDNVIGSDHSVSDPNTPYYPVLRWETNGKVDDWEFHRPWAWPNESPLQVNGSGDTLKQTPTEIYDPNATSKTRLTQPYKPLRAGPYPVSTKPDVFFRLDAPVDPATRTAYEKAQTPLETDTLNEANLVPDRLKNSPLGDPIPFSAHLIGQLVNDTKYSTQFNLDSDRAFAYLTWDWIRKDSTSEGILHLKYKDPVVPPRAAKGWDGGKTPLELQYKDPPKIPVPARSPHLAVPHVDGLNAGDLPVAGEPSAVLEIPGRKGKP
ncbi:MAG: hypothetical protein M3Y57_19745 [Acidobacteriota bacterium]|nr:hypothetical protein [Acidobacteriota bacterium]